MAAAPPDSGGHIAIGWEKMCRDADALAARLELLGPWHGIVAVARGGLVPAALIARRLGIRRVETVAIATYAGMQAAEPVVLKPPTAAGDGPGWLVIDDLVDRGITMRLLRSLLPQAVVAVLYAKPEGLPLADHVVEVFPQEAWLDFPWERGETDGSVHPD